MDVVLKYYDTHSALYACMNASVQSRRNFGIYVCRVLAYGQEGLSYTTVGAVRTNLP